MTRGLDGATLGAQIDPTSAVERCDDLAGIGSRATVLAYNRGRLTADDGSYTFNGINGDVDGELACGIEPGLRLDAKLSSEDTGYPPDPDAYADLLEALAEELGGRVERYSIDNEAAVENHFPDTPEHYFDLLRLASTAIHAGDPDALVVDGAMSYGALGRVQVNHLYDQGRVDDAINLLAEVDANELGGGPPVDTEAELEAHLAEPKVQRILGFFELAVTSQDAFDVFQVHSYGPAASLPSLLATVRDLGITKPIEVWELNHRYRDGRPFVESEHAAEAARLLITAAGEGSGWTIYTNYFDKLDNMNYGLADAAGSPRTAHGSFGAVSSGLSAARSATPLELPGAARGYTFELGQGETAALWSESGAPRVGRDLGIDASTAAVRSTADGARSHVRLADLLATPTPVLVEPDLVVIDPPDRRSRTRVKLKLRCPEGSPFGSCAGQLKIKQRKRPGARTRKSGKGTARYRVQRGETERITVKLERPGKPIKAAAVADRCPDDRRHCKSWARL